MQPNASRLAVYLAASLCTQLSLPFGVRAQTSSAPPQVIELDENGVNIVNKGIERQDLAIHIGSSESHLSAGNLTSNGTKTQASIYTGFFNLHYLPIGGGGGVMLVDGGVGKMHAFRVGTASGTTSNYTTYIETGPYHEEGGGGARLSCNGNDQYIYNGTCIMYENDGTRIKFQIPPRSSGSSVYVTPFEVVKPDGEIISLRYDGLRIKTVSSSLGFLLKYQYQSFSGPSATMTQIVGVNSSVDYCDIAAASCQLTQNALVSDRVGNADVYTVRQNGIDLVSYIFQEFSTYREMVITRPSGVIKTYTTYFSPPVTQTHKRVTLGTGADAKTSDYLFSGSLEYPTYFNVTVTNPDSSLQHYTVADGMLINERDELDRFAGRSYSQRSIFGGTPRITSESELGAPPPAIRKTTQYEYTHGVLSKITKVPTDGSPNQVTKLDIPLACDDINFRVCGKPAYIEDPREKRTYFTYNAAHGGVVTETLPPDANGVSPQKRYTYTQLYPKVRNANGVLVNSPPVWRLTRISECITATAVDPASCVGTPDERVTTYSYNDNNLFRTSETVAAGDGSGSSTISYSYDYAGNIIVVDGPRTDVDDRKYTSYDMLRRPVFEVGADPDGTEPLPRPIVRHVYDMDGRESRTDHGHGSATDGSDFVADWFERATFDPLTGSIAKKEVVQP